MNTRQFLIIAVLALLFPASLASSAVSICPKELEASSVPGDGRIQPLLAHAEDSLKAIWGRGEFSGMTATEVYCRLSLSSLFPDLVENLSLLIPVKREETRSYLGLKSGEEGISASDLAVLMPKIAKESAILEGRYGANPDVKDLQSLVTKAALYIDITAGNDWKIPTAIEKSVSAANVNWKSVITLSGSSEEITGQALKLGRNYESRFGSAQRLELRYRRLHLTRWALLVAFFALAYGFAAKSVHGKPLLIAVGTLFLVEIAEIALRVTISGHAPVANMYESVMGAGIAALGIAFLLARYRDDKAPLLAGLFFNVICLFMLNFSGGMLDARMRALTPALRDNFWLSTHVTAVTASYAAFALSWLVANAQLVRECFSRGTESVTAVTAKLCYDCLKIGIVLLSLGIFLGALWADYSWGRFWGWDPKETWSLITLLTYIGVLHGRMTRWLNPGRFIAAVAVAFLSVLMTWFGVNYVLATGLHSYGFSEGGAAFLTVVFCLQVLILVGSAATRHLRKTRSFGFAKAGA